MRSLLALLAVPCLLAASLLPDTIGAAHRTGSSQPALAERAVWDEYGLKAWETAAYRSDVASFTVTIWQLGDPTGALAAFEWQRPEIAKPSKLAALAATTKDGLLVAQGQYLLAIAGLQPAAGDLAALNRSLRNIDTTVLPVLPGYLPADHLVPNSERYITGPASLARFLPAIPPSVAGFHFDAEAQMGVFHSQKGDISLVIFNYPSPQIAMGKVSDFEQLPGSMVKRSGPLVAVLLDPADRDMAERLLAKVRWEADVTRSETVAKPEGNPGIMLLNIFKLIGILLLFATVSGLLMGAFRVVMRWIRHGEEPEVMISLHLE